MYAQCQLDHALGQAFSEQWYLHMHLQEVRNLFINAPGQCKLLDSPYCLSPRFARFIVIENVACNTDNILDCSCDFCSWAS
jgi:hypothetical protein